MFQAKAKAPTRVDLAGGTIDLWPIYNQLPQSATVNVGVDLPAKVEVDVLDNKDFTLTSVDQRLAFSGSWQSLQRSQELPLLRDVLTALWSPELPALSIRTEAKSPAGAGLGGSSCLALTLIACLQQLRAKWTGESVFTEERLIETAQNIESRIIKSPTGCQDYWGAARGALNVISFPETGEHCETYSLDEIEPFAAQLMLVYSGKSRASAINNWEIFKRVFDGDKPLLEKLTRIGALSYQCGEAVAMRDWDHALELSRQEWRCRTDLWPAVETDETKRITAAAAGAGATLARVCGAGGGGVMAIFAPADLHQAVKKAVTAVGGTVLPAGMTRYGLSVEINEF